VSYTLAISGRVFLVSWNEPEPRDLITLRSQLLRAREAAGVDLLYLAVISEASPPPPDALRQGMGEGLRTILRHCESVYIIVEGTGFLSSVKRGFLAASFLIGGMRGRMHVAASEELLLESVLPGVRTELASALAAARDRGTCKVAA
jgi:hypothetical protein